MGDGSSPLKKHSFCHTGASARSFSSEPIVHSSMKPKSPLKSVTASETKSLQPNTTVHNPNPTSSILNHLRTAKPDADGFPENEVERSSLPGPSGSDHLRWQALQPPSAPLHDAAVAAQQRMRQDLSKKPQEELVELSIQLHQLLSQALRDQHLLSRTKTKQKLLEQENERLRKEVGALRDAPEHAVRNTLQQLERSLKETQKELEVLKIEGSTSVRRSLLVRSSPVVIKVSPDPLLCAGTVPVEQQFHGTPDAKGLRPGPLLTSVQPAPSTPASPTSFPGTPPSYHCSTEKKPKSPSVTLPTVSPEPKLVPPNRPNLVAALTQHFGKKAPPPLKRPNVRPPLKEKAPALPLKPSHNRLQLYWIAPPHGSPPRVGGAQKKASEISTSAAVGDEIVLSKEFEMSSERNVMCTSRASSHVSQLKDSIFTMSPDPADEEELKSIVEDSRVELWFSKRVVNPRKIIRPKTDTLCVCGPAVSRRPSVLGAAASQKYHITAHCFKKAFDSQGGWSAFKTAVLTCRLTKSQISLLLETVPDYEGGKNTRKHQDWEDAVKRVETFRSQNPQEPLYEDEEFVHYVASIPNLAQRLQCMLIMTSFSDLLNHINADINVLMDGIEILTRSKGIFKLFQTILRLGNFLNEGTALGNRKWFRISTLRRVMELKGTGPNAKSLLFFLALHLGAIVSNEELAVIVKAAQISIVKVIQNAVQIYDIFKLLCDHTNDANSLLKSKRRNSLTPAEVDTSDRFAEIGAQFVKNNTFEFMNLREDIRRLLMDYQSCVTYFGDPDYFLPLDKLVEDEKNPGQKRTVPDIFSVFHQFLSAYRPALREAEAERGNEKHDTRKGLKRSQTTSALQQSTTGRTVEPVRAEGHQAFKSASCDPIPIKPFIQSQESFDLQQEDKPGGDVALQVYEAKSVADDAVMTSIVDQPTSLFPSTGNADTTLSNVRMEAAVVSDCAERWMPESQSIPQPCKVARPDFTLSHPVSSQKEDIATCAAVGADSSELRQAEGFTERNAAPETLSFSKQSVFSTVSSGLATTTPDAPVDFSRTLNHLDSESVVRYSKTGEIMNDVLFSVTASVTPSSSTSVMSSMTLDLSSQDTTITATTAVQPSQTASSAVAPQRLLRRLFIFRRRLHKTHIFHNRHKTLRFDRVTAQLFQHHAYLFAKPFAAVSYCPSLCGSALSTASSLALSQVSSPAALTSVSNVMQPPSISYSTPSEKQLCPSHFFMRTRGIDIERKTHNGVSRGRERLQRQLHCVIIDYCFSPFVVSRTASSISEDNLINNMSEFATVSEADEESEFSSICSCRSTGNSNSSEREAVCTSLDHTRSGRRNPRASLRPSLFGATPECLTLEGMISTLEGARELVTNTSEKTSSSHKNNVDPADGFSHIDNTEVTSHIDMLQNSVVSTSNTGLWKPTLSCGLSFPGKDKEVRRRRESLRAVTGFLTAFDRFPHDQKEIHEDTESRLLEGENRPPLPSLALRRVAQIGHRLPALPSRSLLAGKSGKPDTSSSLIGPNAGRSLLSGSSTLRHRIAVMPSSDKAAPPVDARNYSFQRLAPLQEQQDEEEEGDADVVQ